MTKEIRELSDLKPASYNPRKITAEAAGGLQASIRRFGDVSGITWNRRTGNLVAGHQRVEQLRKLGAVLQRSGDDVFVVHEGERFAVRVVDWDHETEVEANITANNPHIAGVFTSDVTELLQQLAVKIPEDEFAERKLKDLLESVELNDDDESSRPVSGSDVEYTKKVDGPVYQITGEKPQLSDLFDTDKLRALVREIDESNIGDDEKHYLRHAAYRHVAFRYDRAAEYYAHASPEMQRLMEASALVIPDFDRAIELGFVKLTKNIAEAYERSQDAGE